MIEINSQWLLGRNNSLGGKSKMYADYTSMRTSAMSMRELMVRQKETQDAP